MGEKTDRKTLLLTPQRTINLDNLKIKKKKKARGSISAAKCSIKSILYRVIHESWGKKRAEKMGQQDGRRPQRKYGVVVLGGITRSESGTARNNFGSLVFTSLKTMIEAIFPQR